MTTNQKKNIAVFGATLASVVIALPVFAQTGLTQSLSVCGGGGLSTGATSNNIQDIVCVIYKVINIVIPVLILGAVAYFIWGIVEFITAKDAEEKSKSRGQMIHGIIGFVVILGLWGLVTVLLNTFGLSNKSTNNLNLPTF